MMRSIEREKERKGYNNIRYDIIHIIDQKRKPADRTDSRGRGKKTTSLDKRVQFMFLLRGYYFIPSIQQSIVQYTSNNNRM